MHKFLFFLMLLAAGCASSNLPKVTAQDSSPLALIASSPSFEALLVKVSGQDFQLDFAEIGTVRTALWNKLREEYRGNGGRKGAFDAGNCNYAPGKSGRFSLKIKGEAPANGYPVFIGLHGGGGAPPDVNDSQWEAMKRYYLGGIESGIYVAPRGPNNTWNLHFDEDAQAFYGQLMGELRLFANVDPNRIYLLGYSAGGDGVYQLSPRFASQLAAANMSAGHHNGVRADNLQHLPMLLQVGELDDAYNRHLETVKYAKILDSLETLFPGCFTHQVYVHAAAQHSYVKDRNGKDFQAEVLADPRAWLLDQNKKNSTTAQTNAPTWVSKFVRNPHPSHLRWDLSTRTEGGEDWYWISVPMKEEGTPFAEVKYVSGQNRIEIIQMPNELRLNLHEAFIDPSKPLTISVEGKEFTLNTIPSLQTIAKSLFSSADPNYGFWQTVVVKRDINGVFTVE